MSAQRRLAVRKEVLVWARTAAKLDPGEAARRVGVSEGRLREWEDGQADPTIIQLRKLAETYNRPLGALFVAAPPVEADTTSLPDFRRAAVELDEPAALTRAVLRGRQQQEAVRDVLTEVGEVALPQSRIIDLRDQSVAEAGAVLRSSLGIDQLPGRVVRRPEEFLRALVRAVEGRGYLVIQVQRVPIEAMRGFSLGDDARPLIALNGADWPRGKVFTLLHELVHLGLKHSGICDLNHVSRLPEERFCDAVAAAALMPAAAFARASAGLSPRNYDDLRQLAEPFGVSAEAALIRRIDLGLASWEDYSAQRGEFSDAYGQYKQQERDERDPDSPLYYQLKLRDYGRPFVGAMLRAHRDGALSSRDVSQLLGVSYDKLPKLAAGISATGYSS